MKNKITFLGTGTSQGIPVIGCQCEVCLSTDPKDQRLRCSALIQSKNTTIAIDTGPDFRTQMLNAKVDNMDAILLTHFHNDHIAGLDDIRPFNFIQRSPMQVFSDVRTGLEVKEKFAYVFSAVAYPGAPKIHLINHQYKAFEIGDLRIQPIKIMHGKLPITGYRINDIAYLTDVKNIPEDQFELLKELEILVISALRREEHHSHISLSEAIAMSQRIDAKRTYLIHMSHHLGYHAEIQEELPQGIQLAFDGLKVEC